MKDRLEAKPGRVLITPEDGGKPFHAVIKRDGEVIVEGTPLNKNTLLNDETAKMIGFNEDDDPTVSDALYRINKNIKNYQSTFQKLMTGRFI